MEKLVPISRQLLIATAAGVTSLLLGYIQFQIPSIPGGSSDLREIPLLISIAYLVNPLYLILSAAITALGTPPEGSMYSTFVMHLGGLWGMWYFYKLIRRHAFKTIRFILLWVLGVAIYYLGLVLPLMVFTNYLAGINLEIPFVEFYLSLVKAVQFELVATALISGLFIGQRQTRIQLRNNLETLAQHNEQLTRYAFINSHLLRAPLARLLGLAHLLKLVPNQPPSEELVHHFHDACEELDSVVRTITDVLEERGEVKPEDLKDLTGNGASSPHEFPLPQVRGSSDD